MKIAFISYEYPLETAFGGIATYVRQAAKLLVSRGHRVEVFTASPGGGAPVIDDGVTVHRLPEMDHRRFGLAAGRAFAERHGVSRFDVLEGPDYGADAREAVRLVPDIPLVLKLHTPSIMLLRLNYLEPNLYRRLFQAARSLRHGRSPHWGYRLEFDQELRAAHAAGRIERAHADDADCISAPARSILDILRREWFFDSRLGTVVPYPFVPDPDLLDISSTEGGRFVTFIGRLEVRKGVIELARAIPAILKAAPEARFRFVGATEPSPVPGVDMRNHLVGMLGDAASAVDFTGPVTPDAIPKLLAEASVCVFPSKWENFPCVCLEAMAAGRAVIGGQAGGMADMLANGAGVLIPPGKWRPIADNVVSLLQNPDLRRRLGQAAREKLLREYNGERVASLQEESYAGAIERRKALGPRKMSKKN